MNAAVQEQEKEQASVQEAVPDPTLRELLDQIREGVDAYKKREVSADKIRETLSKSRKEEADALKASLSSDDPRLLDRIAKARVQIEVNSMRVAAAEQSRGGGLGEIARLILQLQGRIIQELANLKARCTRAHYEVIAKELDTDAVDRFAIGAGLGRGESLSWRLAALAPDVIELEGLHPYLAWCHAIGNIELTLPRIEQDVSQISQALEKFEAHVGQVHE